MAKKKLSDAKQVLMAIIDDMPDEVAEAIAAGNEVSDEDFNKIADKAIAEHNIAYPKSDMVQHKLEDEEKHPIQIDQYNYIDMANKRLCDTMKFEKDNLPKPMYNFGVQMRNNNTAIARAISDITAEAVYNSSLIALDYITEAMQVNNSVLVDMCKIVDEDE